MARTVVFPTCVIDTVSAEVGMAVVRVLRRRGHDVDVPDGATCCGQPAWNAGRAREAATVAAQSLRALSDTGSDPICVPAGSCATMMRIYWPVLFRLVGDEEAADQAADVVERVREFSEFLATDEGAPTLSPDGERDRVAYHHSCHMLRELGIEEQPEALLASAGADVADWDGARRCCGFGGTFSLKQPEISTAMADDKLDDLTAIGVSEVVGCDTSCLLHLRGRAQRRGLDIDFVHLAEVLDRSGP